MKMSGQTTKEDPSVFQRSIDRWKETLSNSYARYRGRKVPLDIQRERRGIRDKIVDLEDKIKTLLGK